MTRRPPRTRTMPWQRLVLWLLVAAVPWHVAVASAMTLTAVPALAPSATVVVAAAPCHEFGHEAGHDGVEEHAAHAGAGCAACSACCALAAPPMAITGVEPTEAVGKTFVAGVQPDVVFLTDGPLRPPRSQRR